MNSWDGEKMPGGEPGEADTTLRLIASLPAPEGLAERVQGGLRTGASPDAGRVLAWSMASREGFGWLRGAAAAAIVCVVAGGAWWISASTPASSGSAVAAPVHVRQAGGFSNAGAMRTPDTLNGPTLKRQGTGIREQGTERQGNRDQGRGIRKAKEQGQGASIPQELKPPL